MPNHTSYTAAVITVSDKGFRGVVILHGELLFAAVQEHRDIPELEIVGAVDLIDGRADRMRIGLIGAAAHYDRVVGRKGGTGFFGARRCRNEKRKAYGQR